jgi:hypothetical protein
MTRANGKRAASGATGRFLGTSSVPSSNPSDRANLPFPKRGPTSLFEVSEESSLNAREGPKDSEKHGGQPCR